MRDEREKSFKDWCLLYMGIDELIKKETILIQIFWETHRHFAQTVWCHYVFTAFDIFSVNTIEDSNHTLQNELCSLNGLSLPAKPSSAPFLTSPNVSFCLLPLQKPQPVQEPHYCLLQMCREEKMITKISMLPVFSGHWKSDCTFSDNYIFPISLLAWIFPAFASVEVLLLAAHRFPDHPWMHYKCYCMYKLHNA